MNAQPEHSDALVRQKTGRGWDEWVATIDAGPGRSAGHRAIASWLIANGVDGWWAQAVTVGYERITGLRMPGQMPDGTFTVSRSRIVSASAEKIRSRLADPAARALLVPELHLDAISRPGVKSPRFRVTIKGDACGQVQFSPETMNDDRCRLTVAHAKLLTHAEGERWKTFWSTCLERM